MYVCTRERFAPLADLGVIEVPQHYSAHRSLARLSASLHRGENEPLADLGSMSRIPKPGERFRVKVFYQASSGSTSFADRVGFLRQQERNVFLGVYGLGLIFEQKRHLLERNMRPYASFEEYDLLPRYRGAPGLLTLMYSSGHGVDTQPYWRFDLYPVEYFRSRYRLLQFSEAS